MCSCHLRQALGLFWRRTQLASVSSQTLSSRWPHLFTSLQRRTLTSSLVWCRSSSLETPPMTGSSCKRSMLEVWIHSDQAFSVLSKGSVHYPLPASAPPRLASFKSDSHSCSLERSSRCGHLTHFLRTPWSSIVDEAWGCSGHLDYQSQFTCPSWTVSEWLSYSLVCCQTPAPLQYLSRLGSSCRPRS